MYTEEQIRPYLDRINSLNDDEILTFLKSQKESEDYPALTEYFCNTFLEFLQRAYYNYTEDMLKNNRDIQTYLALTELSEAEDLPYYHAVAAFFRGRYDLAMKLLRKRLPELLEMNQLFGDRQLADCLIGPFKGAFPGFWSTIREMLAQYPVENGVLELCDAVPLLYTSDRSDEAEAALEHVLSVNPGSHVAKEYLGYIYYCQNKWGNAAAMFEQIEGELSIFLPEDVYFWMGWCYGKLKESASEIRAYEKAVEYNPAGMYFMNNLGYACYKAKQYQKALAAFQECIDNRWDLRYAVNNYVRTLLAMKRYGDAREFIRNAPSKVSKDLQEKVRKAEKTGSPGRDEVSASQPEMTGEPFENIAAENKKIRAGVKAQQFTSEKLLEEELVLRMSAGLEVFGEHLKIYRRKGIYGRQYTLSNGRRPDLLAEDEKGNLYIIELKKDSGYSDAYAQITDYLEWADVNWKEQAGNIYGIICLNNPSQSLLERVHGDKRVRLFEYQISYAER